MPESRLRRRAAFMRKVFVRPLMLIAIVSPFSLFMLMSLYVLIRDDFVQPKNPDKWKLIALLHGWPWWVWAIATLVLMMIVLVEGAFRYAHPHAEEESLAKPSAAGMPLDLDALGPVETPTRQGRRIIDTLDKQSGHGQTAEDRKANNLRIKALELEVAERRERLQHAQREKGEQAMRQVLEDAERRNPTQPKPELVVGYDRMRGYDNSLMTPGNDPYWNLHPFYIRNDGKATAHNIKIEDTTLGPFPITFAVENTNLPVDVTTSVHILNDGKNIDRKVQNLFAAVINVRLTACASDRIDERIPLRVIYADRSLIQHCDRYDIVLGAHRKEDGLWQEEPVRVELTSEEG